LLETSQITRPRVASNRPTPKPTPPPVWPRRPRLGRPQSTLRRGAGATPLGLFVGDFSDFKESSDGMLDALQPLIWSSLQPVQPHSTPHHRCGPDALVWGGLEPL